ncbi:MAG: DUF4357 domain-containing protein [Selenomonadaceae bacterium]|nr:DUF4357 domain-containing protein [Selenomonadaceae bacterium]
MRLPFDLYEQVKLVDTYMKIKDKPRDVWQPYIRQLSTIYRKYAMSRGIDIDEQYRNVIGITMQMQCFDYVFTQGKHGMKNHISWMKDILDFFKKTPLKFDDLLEEANWRLGIADDEKVVAKEDNAADADMDSVTESIYATYKHIPSDEIWDRPMLAKTIDAYEKMRNLPSDKWDNYIDNLVGTFYDYVDRYRSELAPTMNYETFFKKFRQVEMLFKESGKVRVDYSQTDNMMYQMYRFQNNRFQKYLGVFNSNVDNVDTEYDKNDENNKSYENDETIEVVGTVEVVETNENDDIDDTAESNENYENVEINEIYEPIEQKETVEYDAPTSYVLPQSQSSVELDVYETAKLVELVSRDYNTKELRKLSALMKDYALRREIEDTDDLRGVYHLNRRTGAISRLLNGSDENTDALPMERMVVRLYKNNRAEFDDILAKANILLQILPSDETSTPEKPTEETTTHEEVSTPSAEEQTSNDTEIADFDNDDSTPAPSDDSPIYTEIQTRCLSILANFPNGVGLDSSLDIDRFCNEYEEKYGSLPPGGEEEILETLREVGEERNGKIFPPASREKKELISNIGEEIQKIFSKGYSCVYVESLTERYRDKLNEQEIYSTEDLQDILSLELPKNCEIANGKVILSGSRIDVGNDVHLYLTQSGEPKTLTEICRDLWHIPEHIITQTIYRNRDDIINTATKTFMAVDIFPINADDVEKIRPVLKKALQNSAKGQLSDEECRKIVEENFPDLATDTRNYTTKAFHGALGYLMGGDPPFKGQIVLLSDDDNQSNADIFREFCGNRDRFSLDELAEFAKEKNLQLSAYYNVIRKTVLRINEDEFCAVSTVNFDVSAIDAKLEQFCSESYAPLKVVKNFILLPNAGDMPWNYFLLESYVHIVSQKFKLMHTGFLQNEVTGAMVKRNAPFRDYDDLLADALSKDKNWATEEDALEFLVNEGYLARNRYSKIGEICRKAKEIRKKPKIKSENISRSNNIEKNLPSYNIQKNHSLRENVNLVDGEKEIFYCTSKDSNASAYISTNGFTVLKGSLVSSSVNSSAKRRKIDLTRNWLENEGIIVDRVFQEDYEFSSSSAAASMVTGRSANGKIEWKTSNGRLLKDYGVTIDHGRVSNSQTSTGLELHSEEENPRCGAKSSEKFVDKCIQRLYDHENGNLVKIGHHSCFQNLSTDTGYVVTISKMYPFGFSEFFWFAYRRMKDIAKCKNQFYVFCCKDEFTMIKLPVDLIEKNLDRLNFSKDKEGFPSHWHIKFFRHDDGRLIWKLYNPSEDFSVNEYLIK